MLTYEFECAYDDGQVIHQNPDTPSEVQFGDIDQSKVRNLSLKGKGKLFGVDMDGHFNINGTIVRFDDTPENRDYRPIYFRRIRQTYLNGTVEVVTKYGIGIQATVEGKNIKKILLVDDYGNLEVLHD